MTDSDMYPTFLKLEPKEEIKLEPFDLESHGRSPRLNCNPINDQIGELLTESPSKSDEEKEMKMVLEIEESEINLTLVKEEIEDNNDMSVQNITDSANLKFSKDISKSFQCSICYFKTRQRNRLKSHMLIHTDPSEIRMFKCLNCSYETKRKGNLVMHVIIHKNPGDVEMFKCNICPFKSKRNDGLKNHLNIIHNLQQDQYSESKAKSFQCQKCSYRALSKSKLERHNLVHSSLTYKCDWCDFNSKHKDNLTRHLIKHKDTSEIRMFKCKLCHYENRYKQNFKRHLSVYHNSSASVYKCKSCNYKTKDYSNFKYHAISHKDKSEVGSFGSSGRSPKSNCSSFIDQFDDHLTGFRSGLDEEKETEREFKIEESKINLTGVKEEEEDNIDVSGQNISSSANLELSKDISKSFQCRICDFKTKKRKYLKSHMIIHKDPNEIKMFKCFNCPYEAKRKKNLIEHMVVHKNPGDIMLFKCNICPFKTKRKYTLKKHLTIHNKCNLQQDQNSESNAKRFQCLLCPYKAQFKAKLERHNLVHDNTDTIMYNCNWCDFNSKYRESLKVHITKHTDRDISDKQIVKCESRDYEGRSEPDFKRDASVYHSSSASVYKCETCNYTTKVRSNFRRHLISHKDITEMKTFQCAICDYRSRYKICLMRHIRTHNKDKIKKKK